ncbi:ECF RNA polymerase sigma factor SigW [Pseudobythopirellula maris]|uniref:RNA polymerase sigma factor n=1 Tax=Pseudobythopirellula maris TaxID=2527991 RepID=A0A5C5ZL79_9BACT|nr:sigma-70 family RNA polymerase sigma factor [Pseudobythopirellula maris]TWT88194.1 ECF RNA polymerase sigma factor SigW [Pseudobythopirellula maris]
MVATPRTADGQPDDGPLIDATLAGDSEAYGNLVRRHQERLFQSLLRITGSAEEAEDVAQEAFVQAFVKLETFQRTARFYTWLYRIAFNLAVSKSRKRRPRVSLSVVQEASGLEPIDEGCAPDAPLAQGERAELLREAIAEMADDHREVLLLREFEGCDYQQIAEALSVPVGTVRSRLFRARMHLREKLAPLLQEDMESD